MLCDHTLHDLSLTACSKSVGVSFHIVQVKRVPLLLLCHTFCVHLVNKDLVLKFQRIFCLVSSGKDVGHILLQDAFSLVSRYS